MAKKSVGRSSAKNRAETAAAASRIIISAELPMFDYRDQRTSDPKHLRLLDGFHCDDSLDQYQDREFTEIGVRGGYLRCEFDKADGKLRLVTEYEAPRRLTREELAALVGYTSGQWSDGVGEGCFDEFATVSGFSVETCLPDKSIRARQEPGRAVVPRNITQTQKKLLASWRRAARQNRPRGEAGRLLKCLKAIEAGRREDVAELTRGLDLNAVCKAKGKDRIYDQWTLLTWACRQNRLPIIRDLLKWGADVHAPNGENDPPIHCVRSAPAVKALIEGGADPNTPDVLGKTPLHNSKVLKFPTAVEALLEAGANPRALDRFDGTPLHVAADNGYVKAVDILLNAGADPNAKGTSHTVLSEAAGALAPNSAVTRPKIVKRLLEAGAKPRTDDLWGAILCHDLPVVEMLLAAGVETDNRVPYHGYPLADAAELGDVAIVKRLLTAGADPNVGEGMDTPLATAVAYRFAPIVRLLLRAGAVPRPLDEETSLADYARQRGDEAVIKLIEKAGEKPSQPASTPARKRAAEKGAAPAVRTFEMKKGTSAKFWSIRWEGSSFETHYGRIGTRGQKTTKQFDSKQAAIEAGEKLIRQKLKKGYQEV